VLIFNQNVLDLAGCFRLVMRYSARPVNIYLTGNVGMNSRRRKKIKDNKEQQQEKQRQEQE